MHLSQSAALAFAYMFSRMSDVTWSVNDALVCRMISVAMVGAKIEYFRKSYSVWSDNNNMLDSRFQTEFALLFLKYQDAYLVRFFS